jgi:hypothetical protein
MSTLEGKNLLMMVTSLTGVSATANSMTVRPLKLLNSKTIHAFPAVINFSQMNVFTYIIETETITIGSRIISPQFITVAMITYTWARVNSLEYREPYARKRACTDLNERGVG